MNLKQLATRLNLSVSTVSRALNGYTDINEETRQRCIKAAKAAGYIPNSLAKRLAEGRTATIAVIVPLLQGEFAPPMYLGFLQGIDEALQERGMDALVTMGQDPPNELRPFRRLIEAKRVDGLIFGRPRRDDSRIKFLMRKDIPFVVIGQSPSSKEFPFVDVDRHVAARDAAVFLYRLGHRHIAMLNTPEQFVFSQRARAGFVAGMTTCGALVDEAMIVDAGFGEGSGFVAAAHLLGHPDPPTAFVCDNDLLSIGCMRAMRARGIRPGIDGAVVSCEDNQPARLVDPALTAFSAPAVEVGRKAVELLLRSIAGEPVSTLHHVFEPRLIERGTHCTMQATPDRVRKMPAKHRI